MTLCELRKLSQFSKSFERIKFKVRGYTVPNIAHAV